MATNTDLVVTGLDFDTIRANLRTYIASKPEFTDYDFNDSALGTLLDLLAYNTYMNAFYANMATNEGFLDTAQQYDSVVSHAKTLGYSPTSARGATANVQLIFTSSIANTTFRSIRVPKNTQFTTTVNGTSYTFVTPQTYTITANSSGGFAHHINIKEGTPLSHRYVFNRTSNTSFVLPNENVDTTSITVSVTTSGNVQTYVPADDLMTSNSSSQIFFIEADRQKKYKISFGDGVLGKLPATASIVTVNYRVCNGIAPNGANSFSLSNTTIDGQSDITIVPVGRASGGAEIESIESLRFNAPRAYETQNRTVTSQDYERIALKQNPDIQAISVWGGEENDPPIYGKVFVAAKPRNSTVFSLNRKAEIIANIKKYNVQSIDVEMVDPSYLYIVPEVTVRYDASATNLTPGELASAVAARVISFETNNLSNFNKSFRYSRFLDWLDGTDDSIRTTNANIRLRKMFVPSTTVASNHTINFNTALQKLGPAELISGVTRHPGYGAVTSSSFTYGTNESFFDDNGFGTLRVYYRSLAGRLGRIYTNYNAGTIDYENGIVNINSFSASAYSGTGVSVFVSPYSPNITPVRNQILLISQTRIDIVNDKTNQTVATASNIDTIGQTATIQTPSIRLYNF
jgi:hypothetical protein